MRLNTLKYVLEQLDRARGTWPEIARRTGMSVRTIENIGGRRTKNPWASHVDVLGRYFRRCEAAAKAAATRRASTQLNAST